MNTKYLLILFACCVPEISSFGQAALTLRDGAWDDPSVWSGNLVPDASADVITIRHSVHIRSAAYPISHSLVIDQITVGADGFAGYLTVDPDAYAQLNNGTGTDLILAGAPLGGMIDVAGRLIVSSGVTISGNTVSNFRFLAGSTYEHQAVSASSPLAAAFFDAASTLLINGFTGSGTFSSTWTIPLGNLVYNCPNQGTGAVNFAGFITHLQGNVDIQNTGATGVVYFNQTGTSAASSGSAISIDGNFSVSGISRVFLTSTGTVDVSVGGNFIFNPDLISGTSQCATTGNGTLTVNGAATLQKGTWNFSSGTSGSGTFNLRGSVLSVGAVLTETGGGTSQGNLNFIGTEVQHFDPAGVAATTINVAINNTSGVILTDTLALTGALALTAGVLTLPDVELTLNGPIVQGGGLIATTGIPDLIVGGTGSLPATLSIANGSTFNLFQVNRPSAMLVSNSSFTVNRLALYAGTFVNQGTVTLADGGLIERKATSAAATGILSHPVTAAGRYDISYTNSIAITSGPELPFDSVSLNNFTKSGTDILSLVSDVTIRGDLNITAGTLSDGDTSRLLTLFGNFVSNGNSDLAASTFTFAHNQFGTSLSGSVNPTFGKLLFSNPVIISEGFRVDGDLTIAPGMPVTATSGTLSFGGTTFITNQGILRLSGVTVLSNAAVTVGDAPLSAAGNFTVSSSGSFMANAGADLTLSGNLSVTGAFSSHALVTFADTTKMTGTGIKSFGDILISGSLTPNAPYTITRNLLTDGIGTLNAGNSTTTFGGNTHLHNSGTGTITFNNMTIADGQALTADSEFAITGATLNWNAGSFHSSASLHLNRSGVTTLRGIGAIDLASLIIATRTTFTPDAPYTITGNLVVNGTLRPGNSTTTFGGASFITGAGTPAISFNNLEIAPGDSLTSFSGLITINGNFTNNGFFYANEGTITFAGNTTKNISGASVTRFHAINVSNGTAATDVSIESNQCISGVLTLSTNAHLDADGSSGSQVLTLLSSGDDPTRDASVASLPTGAIVQGNVTVQRYLSLEGPNHDRIYRYLSSPVSNAFVSDLQNEIPVTGSFTGSSICSGCSNNPSMFWYDETVATDGINGGYTPFPVLASSEVLVPGRGYATFVRGDISPVLSAGSARYDLRGPINAGLINYNVTFTPSGKAADDGWNLIGNPYPSTIDWNAKGWTKTRVSGSIYTLNNGVNPNQYAIWNGQVSINGGSRYVASGQGFFIQAAAALPALTSTETVKVAGQQTTYFRQGDPAHLLRLTLVQGDLRDEAVIHFRDSATIGFDVGYDAIKLKNLQNDNANTPFFNLSTLSPLDHQQLAINTLPSSLCSTNIPLDVSDVPEGTYELDFSNAESFSSDISLFLADNFDSLRSTVDLRQQHEYVFRVTSDPASFGSGRFKVLISNAPVPTRLSLHVDPVCQGHDAFIAVDSTRIGFSYFLKMKRTQFGPTLPGTGAQLTFPIPRDSLALGYNPFEVWLQADVCSTSVYGQVDSIKVVELSKPQASSTFLCHPGQVTLTATGAPLNGYYKWYSGAQDLDPIPGDSSSNFTTPTLFTPTTYYVAAVNSLGCEGERIPVVAGVVNYLPASITQLDENTLQSNADVGNHWYLDGQLLSDTTVILRIHSSGTYTLVVNIGSCTSSDEKTLVVTGLDTRPGFKAYPNPVSGLFLLEIPNGKNPVDELPIFNANGERVGTIVLSLLQHTSAGQFDFSSYPAGFYYIRNILSTETLVVKVIKR